MPASANLFQQYLQPPKSVADYMGEMDSRDMRREQLAGMRNTNQINALTAQQTADSLQQNAIERAALRTAAAGSGGDTNALIKALRATGLPGLYTQADALEKGAIERTKGTAVAAKDTAEAEKTTQATAVAAHQQHLQALAAVNGPEDGLAWLGEGLRNKALTPEQYQRGIQNLQTASATPDGFQQWKQGAMRGGMSVLEQMQQGAAKPTEVRLGNVVKTVDMNPYSTTYGKEVVPAQAIGQSADNAATTGAHIQGIKLQQSGENLRAGINQDGTGSDTGGLLSPESVINAAARYNMDGTLPPNLGRGTQGPRQTAQILNEAARQAAARGDTPEAQRIAQLANKANATALNKLETQQTMVGAFEKNFTKNAAIAEELSNKVDRTGVPIVNKWVNVGKRAVTGDPDLAAFDASVKATVNEYAKIVGGGTGGSATAQGEIAKIEGLLSAAQTKEGVLSVLNLMRRETANRMTSFDDQKAELKGSMIPAKKPAPGGAPAAGKVVNFGDLK